MPYSHIDDTLHTVTIMLKYYALVPSSEDEINENQNTDNNTIPEDISQE